MSNSNHMLDTNIVLSVVLPNEYSEDLTKNYLKVNFIRYISNTSCEESNKKISDIKLLSFSISEFVKCYSLENNVNFLKLNKVISEIKKLFLANYNNYLPINVTENRFEGMVTDFFKSYDDELKSILINCENEDFNKLIRKSLKKYKIKLNIFLGNFKCITIQSYEQDVDNLKKIGLDNLDAILLSEASNLQLTLNSQVNFITYDKNILSLKNQIFKSLSQSVIVSSPMEFVSVNN